MSGYLSNLASRALGRPASIRPRLASFFEPANAPGIRFTEALTPKRGKPPRTDSPRRQDHTTVTHAPEADLEVSTIHHVAQPGPGPVESLQPLRDERPKLAPASLYPRERSTQAITPDASVVPNPEFLLDRHVSAGPATEINSSRDPVPAAPDEQAYRAELEAIAPGSEAALAERTVVSEPPVSTRIEQAIVEGVTAGARPEMHPRPPVIVRPFVAASYAAPSPYIQTPATTREAAPAIRITIGRVDVRAIMPSAPAGPRVATTRASAGPSLDDYLKQRNGAKP